MGRHSFGKQIYLLSFIRANASLCIFCFSLFKQKLTFIGINLDAITFLQTRSPASFIPCSTLRFLYSVTCFKSFFPLSLIHPFSPKLNAKSVPTAAKPISLKTMAIWPNIHSTKFESVVPRAFVARLSFRPGADPVAVCFAVFPFAAISSTIFKVKATTAHNHPRQA